MRRRILLATLAVATLAVVLFGVPMAVGLRSQYRDEATLRLERLTIQAARDIGNGAFDGSDPAEVPTVPGIRLGLYTATGTRLGGDGPPEGDVVVTIALNNKVADANGNGVLRVAVPLVADERVIGVLRGEQAAAGVTSRVHHTWLLMAALGAIAIAVAGMVARSLARRLTRPLDHVRDAAVRLGDGDFTVVVAPSGVAELDVVATALTSTAARLGQQIARERSFAADASHQLRTPLTGLRLTLEAELDAPRTDHTLALAESLSEVERLEQTVNSLLALARRDPIDRQPLDVAIVITEAEQRWHGPLALTGRAIRAELSTALSHPRVSSAAIATVLDVLIDNAHRHGNGTVTISGRTVTGGVVLAVSDEGAGITDLTDLVFERRDSDRSGGGSGHGIGLPLARALAEAEGGRLDLVRTGPNPTFELTLAV